MPNGPMRTVKVWSAGKLLVWMVTVLSFTTLLMLKVGMPLMRDRGGLLLAVAAFVAVHLLHWPLVPVVAVLGPLGVLWAWPRERVAGAPT